MSVELALLLIEFTDLFTVGEVLVRELSEGTHLCKVLRQGHQGTGKVFIGDLGIRPKVTGCFQGCFNQTGLMI